MLHTGRLFFNMNSGCKNVVPVTKYGFLQAVFAQNVYVKNIIGKNGVAFATVSKKTLPTELNNYNGNRKSLERFLSARSLEIFEALKENSDIEDNRAVFY